MLCAPTGCREAGYLRHNFLRRPELLRALLPPTPFDLPVRQALRPHRDPQREADQVGILKLHAGAVLAIDASGSESVNAASQAEAQAERVSLNVVDRPERCGWMRNSLRRIASINSG